MEHHFSVNFHTHRSVDERKRKILHEFLLFRRICRPTIRKRLYSSVWVTKCLSISFKFSHFHIWNFYDFQAIFVVRQLPRQCLSMKWRKPVSLTNGSLIVRLLVRGTLVGIQIHVHWPQWRNIIWPTTTKRDKWVVDTFLILIRFILPKSQFADQNARLSHVWLHLWNGRG